MATIIEKPNGSVLIRVSEGYTQEGKRVFRSKTFKPQARKGTKAYEKEVAAFAVDFERLVKDGKYYASADKTTFQEFAAQWDEKSASKTLTPSERDQYNDTLRRHVYPVIGSLKIGKVSPLACQDVIDRLEKKGLSVSSMKRCYTAMNAVFRYALRMGIISENPCAGRVTIPKEDKKEGIHFLTVEQAKRFLSFLGADHEVKYQERHRTDKNGKVYAVRAYTAHTKIPIQWSAFFVLAIFAGCRRGELLALTWNDISFEKFSISISKAIAKTKAGEVTKSPKSNAGYRTITLPPVCFTILQQWKEEEYSKAAALGTAWEGAPLKSFEKQWLFIQDNGKRMNLSTPTHKFKEILRQYNAVIQAEAQRMDTEEDREAKLEEMLPDIHLHDLRHSIASYLIGEGVDPATVSRRLGHSKVSHTLDIYTHALPSKDKEAIQKIDELFNDGKADTDVPAGHLAA